MTTNADMFHELDVEMWFVKRLKDHGHTVFLGDTTPEIRRERIRTAILDAQLDTVIIGRAPNGRPERYAESFERFYKQPLIPKSKEKRA